LTKYPLTSFNKTWLCSRKGERDKRKTTWVLVNWELPTFWQYKSSWKSAKS